MGGWLSKEDDFCLLAHLEQSVRGVLFEEGARRPLPPGARRRHLRLHLSQRVEPHRDGAPPDQQALQLFQVGVAAAALQGGRRQRQR